MISRDNDIEKFCGLVEALRPWLGRIVFVGGWAHRLYRERPESAQLPYAPLRTTDADVALDPRTIGRSEEVLSPSTASLDRVKKLTIYARGTVSTWRVRGEGSGRGLICLARSSL